MFTKKSKILFFFFSLIFCFFLASCTNKKKRPSFLILALESLGFDKIHCHKTERNSSINEFFQTFCNESIWFTHAFTPSIMSQAALTSVLVGKYPHEHKVWDNGKSFLAEKNQTIVEEALKNGYKTAFFSGGPPIWRKSGLSQGFEVFNDFIDINLNSFHRPALNSFKLFLNWLNQSVKSKPFFSVIYLSDLQFPHSTTYTDLGKIRNLSYESQLKEIEESLNFLFQSLKRKKKFNNTHIVLIGLNGTSDQHRPNELDSYNLHSENTQVALFFKPARKKNSRNVLGWKINQNVSLVDLGATFYSLLNRKYPVPVGRKKNLQVISLKEAFDKPGGGKENWNLKRLILTESAWPQWRKFGISRFAVRKEHYLFLFDQKISIYNTLIDRFERTPLLETDPLWNDLYAEIKTFLEEMGFLPWKPLEESLVQKLDLGKYLWRKNKPLRYMQALKELKILTQKRPTDPEVQSWIIHFIIQNEDWKQLKRIGEQSRNLFLIYLAEKKLGFHKKNLLFNNLKLKEKFETKCGKYFFSSFNPKSVQNDKSSFFHSLLKDCEDSLFVYLLNWIYEENKKKKTFYKERFIRAYLRYKKDQNISRLNQSKFLIWDVNRENSYDLNLTDLYLLLPKTKKYLKQLESRLKN